MAVSAIRIGRLESIDGHICHTIVLYGDSTVYYSRIGDRHLRYPGKLRRAGPSARWELEPMSSGFTTQLARYHALNFTR